MKTFWNLPGAIRQVRKLRPESQVQVQTGAAASVPSSPTALLPPLGGSPTVHRVTLGTQLRGSEPSQSSTAAAVAGQALTSETELRCAQGVKEC